MKKIIPWQNKVRQILSHDDIGLFAIDKPKNILSHPNSGSGTSILRCAYDMKEEAFDICNNIDSSRNPLYLLHRLDKSTSGVLLLANTKAVADYVKKLFKSRVIEKKYVAIVHSPTEILPKNQIWTDSYKYKKGAGEQIAKTIMTVQNYNADLRLAQLLLEPKTGFTHQLRIQCAIHGFPILGDDQHGNFPIDKYLFQTAKIKRSSNSLPIQKRLYLHSHSISFPYDYQGIKKTILCTAPVPSNFSILFDAE